MYWFFAGILAFSAVLSAAFTWLMIRCSPKIGLMDMPAARKIHHRPVPMGGGVAIFLANVIILSGMLLVAYASKSSSALEQLIPSNLLIHRDGVISRAPLLLLMLSFATVQMLVGLSDDWRRGGLSYQIRLAIETALVLILAYNGIMLTINTSLIWITLPVTVLWVVGLTNAFNFLDNMDGLSSGVALIASMFFTAVALQLNAYFVAASFLILAGSLVGFLCFNWNPAQIFMGDAGSNFIGFWIGVLTIASTFSIPGQSHITLAAPLCILAVPIYDSATVILLRLWQGKSPFKPDKQHLSHRLIELGYGVKSAVLIIYLLALSTGLAGFLLYYVTPWASGIVLAQVACSLGVLALLEFAAFHKVSNGKAKPIEPPTNS